MLNRILRKARRYATAALALAMRGSGTAALYLCTSTLLAAILLATYLMYSHGIDKERAYKAYSVFMGYDVSDIQQAAQDRIAELSYENTLERRAQRVLEEDFNREVRQLTASLPVLPDEPEPEPPPPDPAIAERASAEQRRIQNELDRARAAGRDELTRLLEDRNMDVEQAKEIIRKFWKDGFKDLVLSTLLDMADRRRGDILYAFDHNNADELKDYTEILKDIYDGKPMTTNIENRENNAP